MKNVTQSIDFPVSLVLKNSIPQAITDLLTSPNTLSKEELVLEVQKRMPEPLANELERFGCKLPTDKVSLHMSSGTLCFDIYSTFVKPPEAPLAKLAHQKKAMDLADLFMKPDFRLTDDVSAIIRSAMENDSKWCEIEPTVWIKKEVDGQTKDYYFKVNYRAINHFNEVLDSIIKELT